VIEILPFILAFALLVFLVYLPKIREARLSKLHTAPEFLRMSENVVATKNKGEPFVSKSGIVVKTRDWLVKTENGEFVFDDPTFQDHFRPINDAARKELE